MLFLETRSGFISHRAIVRIGAVNTRPTGDFHEIDYTVGQEGRSTTATADAVQDFFDEALQ